MRTHRQWHMVDDSIAQPSAHRTIAWLGKYFLIKLTLAAPAANVQQH